MKRIVFFFIGFFYSAASLYAQQVDNYHQDTTTLYQWVKGFSTDPIRSKWRQKLKKEEDLWTLYLFDKKDVLQERIPFADKELLERKGAYRLYQNGQIKEEGAYDKGYKVGEWKYYYPKGQLYQIINYTWDKIGSKKLFYKDGKLALDEVYNRSGNLEIGKYFDEQGKAVDLSYVKKALN